MLIRIIVCCMIFCSCSSSKQVETKLYFGQFKLDGGTVSEKEWNEFIANYVSKVFPGGSTVENASGNWYDTAMHKLVVEPSKVITTVNMPSARLDQQIDSLGYWYKKLFQQQSVLRVDRKVNAKLF
ncbi:DUF3574 domain-containing protein [Terrimonas sp. NA20]|uniref:DUF3574 domain-containing protein n=1 Tax=Terrimonas ginsenosidimutans TaxID=2908004 RepID=A0ABS9KWU3_9BACT|nr:DUF3574 domain-containing protein [Terrimonas ginsenosidimutans]MCG2616753.1 DUF3574 domain-containing protein [Terrimonas ginsenosidimutans]